MSLHQIEEVEITKSSYFPTMLIHKFPYFLLSGKTSLTDKSIKVKYHFTSQNIKEVVDKVIDLGFAFVETYKIVETYYDDEYFTNMKQNTWIKIVNTSNTKFKKISKKQASIIESNHIKYEEGFCLGCSSKLQPQFMLVVYRSIYQKENIQFTYDTVEYQEHKFVVFCISGNVSESSATVDDNLHDPVFEVCMKSRSKIIEIIWRTNKELYKILQENNVIPDLEYSSFNFEPLIDRNSSSFNEMKKRVPRKCENLQCAKE
ncbi:predicted protein [Naegleria gruberi]|uniref:Predicted protein n=1 Tax=Naegleria gruberi TaxID=5762 RepID=D2VVZ2_NAEGR|nr:uncharacterized protein NAEGRDRAFT_73191 [Naegleria gruberi]EFC38986.1 predicted protein [Naegleria gruberi]|eukprot:XP_002671730.1 predicted protein [Naegleria gruberi strain NEG-M]